MSNYQLTRKNSRYWHLDQESMIASSVVACGILLTYSDIIISHIEMTTYAALMTFVSYALWKMQKNRVNYSYHGIMGSACVFGIINYLFMSAAHISIKLAALSNKSSNEIAAGVQSHFANTAAAMNVLYSSAIGCISVICVLLYRQIKSKEQVQGKIVLTASIFASIVWLPSIFMYKELSVNVEKYVSKQYLFLAIFELAAVSSCIISIATHKFMNKNN